MTDNRTNEPRPNPTAEQIVRGVRKLLNRYSLRGDVPCDEIDKLIDDSEAGLLSEGAPSEAQARAIRKLDNVQAILAGAQASVTDAVRELSLTSAALTAAQGAAPQAESEDNVTCRCGHGTGSHDFSDPQESCREIVCDCRGWFGVSPVLPRYEKGRTMSDDLTALRRMAEANARIAEEVGNASGSISFAPQFVLSLLDRLERAEEAIERVRAVHGQHPRWPDKCGGCDGYYPCPTLAALDTGKEKNDE